MAVLKASAEFKTQGFADLAKQFPDFRGRWLGYMGKIARTRLKNIAPESGVNLGNRLKSEKNRYIVGSHVDKRKTSVTITSFVLNLFEENRVWKKGKFKGRSESGRHIIKVKLKNDISAKTCNCN